MVDRLQKREQEGGDWTPKFFAPAPGMGVLPGEESEVAVPLWRWTGKYSETKQDAAPAASEEWQGEAAVLAPGPRQLCMSVSSIEDQLAVF